MNEAIGVLEDLHNTRRLLQFVLRNHDDIFNKFDAVVEGWLEMIKSGKYPERKEFDECFLEANRLLLNYLSSYKTFVDHLQTYITRTYGGEGTPEYQEFKTITAVFYDNSFAYRFFYALRNYAQHCGVPVGRVKFDTRREPPNINYDFKVVFDRDGLLSTHQWKEKIREDLKSKDTEFELIPLLFEMTNNINEISRNLEITLSPKFIEAAKYLKGVFDHLPKSEGRVFIAYDVQTTEAGKLSGYTDIDIPMETIEGLLSGDSGE